MTHQIFTGCTTTGKTYQSNKLIIENLKSDWPCRHIIFDNMGAKHHQLIVSYNPRVLCYSSAASELQDLEHPSNIIIIEHAENIALNNDAFVVQTFRAVSALIKKGNFFLTCDEIVGTLIRCGASDELLQAWHELLETAITHCRAITLTLRCADDLDNSQFFRTETLTEFEHCGLTKIHPLQSRRSRLLPINICQPAYPISKPRADGSWPVNDVSLAICQYSSIRGT